MDSIKDNENFRQNHVKTMLKGSSAKAPKFLLGTILEDFYGQSPTELDVKKGEEVYIMFEINDWAFVTSIDDNARRGYIPLDYCLLLQDFFSTNPLLPSWNHKTVNTNCINGGKAKRVLFPECKQTMTQTKALPTDANNCINHVSPEISSANHSISNIQLHNRPIKYGQMNGMMNEDDKYDELVNPSKSLCCIKIKSPSYLKNHHTLTTNGRFVPGRRNNSGSNIQIGVIRPVHNKDKGTSSMLTEPPNQMLQKLSLETVPEMNEMDEAESSNRYKVFINKEITEVTSAQRAGKMSSFILTGVECEESKLKHVSTDRIEQCDVNKLQHNTPLEVIDLDADKQSMSHSIKITPLDRSQKVEKETPAKALYDHIFKNLINCCHESIIDEVETAKQEFKDDCETTEDNKKIDVHCTDKNVTVPLNSRKSVTFNYDLGNGCTTNHQEQHLTKNGIYNNSPLSNSNDIIKITIKPSDQISKEMQQNQTLYEKENELGRSKEEMEKSPDKDRDHVITEANYSQLVKTCLTIPGSYALSPSLTNQYCGDDSQEMKAITQDSPHILCSLHSSPLKLTSYENTGKGIQWSPASSIVPVYYCGYCLQSCPTLLEPNRMIQEKSVHAEYPAREVCFEHNDQLKTKLYFECATQTECESNPEKFKTGSHQAKTSKQTRFISETNKFTESNITDMHKGLKFHDDFYCSLACDTDEMFI